MKLLINSQPLLLLKELAVQIGDREALFLQQLHYWIESDLAHYIDNKWWIYNTYNDWREDNFPFWSDSTIRRIVKSLKEKELIITTDKYNNWSQDRTTWYSINYEKLKQYEEISDKLQKERRKKKDEKNKIREKTKLTRKIYILKKNIMDTSKIQHGQNDQSIESSKIPTVQNEQSDCSKTNIGLFKMNAAIPEITTKNTSKITKNNNTTKKNIPKKIKYTSEEIKNIAKEIEDVLQREVNIKILKDTVKKNNLLLNDIRYYLDNWNKFDGIIKNNPIGFLLGLAINKAPLPKRENGYTKPDQAYNFEQRVYDDDYFDGLYDNF